MSHRLVQRTAVFLALAGAGLAAHAAPVAITINAQDDIYRAAGNDGSDGMTPTGYSIAGMSTFTLSITPSGQTITLNGTPGSPNDADGIGSASSFNVNGVLGLSGISGDHAGELVGVFLGSTLGGTAPASLNYSANGGNSSTSDATYAPLLQQVFFIGDGLTGDGTGAVQTFTAPTGATMLYLGIADAGGYNGNPGSYGDNTGMFTASLDVVGNVVIAPPPPAAGVPEPSSLALLGLGIATLALRRKRRVVG